MSWVMSSEVKRQPWCLTFYIGAIPVCCIDFESKKPVLHSLYGDHGPFETVSAAMTEMHRLLNSPPPDGAKIATGPWKGPPP